MPTYLDFEAPLAELEGKIAELRALPTGDKTVSISDEVKGLEKKAAKQLTDLYANLEPWQKAQVARHPERPQVVAPVTIPEEGLNFASVVSQLERDLILGCLEKTGGNKRQAARLLQLSRTTLIDKLQRLGAGEQQAVA